MATELAKEITLFLSTGESNRLGPLIMEEVELALVKDNAKSFENKITGHKFYICNIGGEEVVRLWYIDEFKVSLSDAKQDLYEYLFSHLKNKHNKTIDVLSKDERDERVKWIKSSFSFSLINHTFKDYLEGFEDRKKEANVFINKSFNKKEYHDFSDLYHHLQYIIDIDKIQKDQNIEDIKIACWVLLKTKRDSSFIVSWIKEHMAMDLNSENIERFGKDINQSLISNIIDKHTNKYTCKSATKSSPDSYEEDTPESYEQEPNPLNAMLRKEENKDIIEKQKKAFFWVSGEPCNEEIIENESPLFLAFFYRWLHYRSGANDILIAKHIGVSPSTVGRWVKEKGVKRNPVLSKYFPDPDTNEISDYPIHIEPNSREAIGMYKDNIRCYSGPDFNGIGYDEVKDKKNIIWK